MANRSELQYAAIAAAASGDNTLVAAVAGARIRVHSLVLVASGGAVSVRFESGAGGDALTGVMDIADNGQLILSHNPGGWLQTDVADLLNLELSSAVAVAGSLTYSVIENI